MLLAQPPVPKDVKILYRQLRSSQADTGRVNIFVDISRYCNANSVQQIILIDSAIVIAQRANALSAKLSYSKGLGLSYQAWAQALCKKGDFKKSEELLIKAIAVFLSNNLHREAAECYLNLQENYASSGGKDYNIMADYYAKAHVLFRKAHAFDRDAATLEHMGDFYYLVEKYHQGITALKSALVSYRLSGNKKTQAVYDLLGINYLKIERYKDALKNALVAVKIAESVQDTSMLLCTIYNRTGMIYLETGHFDQANYYFKRSIGVAQKYKDPSAIFLVANLANNLLHQGKPTDAITVLNENERLFPDIDERYRTYYNAFYLQANVALKNYREAEKYAQRLLKANAEGEHDPVLVVTMLGPSIEYFIAARSYQEAAKLLPAFKNAVNASGKQKFIVKLHFFTYKIDSAQHNYVAALNNYQKYAALQDSIAEATKNKQIQQLQVQFETEQKENAITSLKHEGVLQREKITRANNTRNLTLAVSVMLLVVAGVSLNSYRTKQRGNKALNVLLKEKDKLLVEKEWLLKEIHHRVKNNLQIVMGLLQRQSAYINNNEALAAIQNSENRMHSIALIHQKLYQSENLDLINMPEYIDEMLSYLKHSCDDDNRILFEKHTDDILLDVAQAVPLGLILNEAVTNAIKYAYKPPQTGTIYVTLVRNGDGYNQLTIADDGAGLPAGFAIDKVESLGINLMRGLSKQLGGTFDIYGDEGCTINVVFKTEVFNREISKNE
ncbi:tetratricopeptide repeat-containing sensor histidine kinase [Mucilaginibacter auburnensis]|uniref:tetratricopeptide repeat-containing sensor histidine kinase n=1 Tax=Mucilaginibacter auburnensis TaxID=1457233 RepID=UPI0014748D04|nr:histidine kinase dimerization/phosphoacceptor domain -containing protein [Mucilaginibacter auburnensis]